MIPCPVSSSPAPPTDSAAPPPGVLIGEGHDVILHARTRARAAALSDLAPDAAGVVIGDLSSAAETRELADQVNRQAWLCDEFGSAQSS